MNGSSRSSRAGRAHWTCSRCPDVGRSSVDLAVLYRDGVLAHQLERLSVSNEIEPMRPRQRPRGVRFHCHRVDPGTGAAVEGSVTAVISPSGGSAVFDGWAFQGPSSFSRRLAAMVNGAEVA